MPISFKSFFIFLSILVTHELTFGSYKPINYYINYVLNNPDKIVAIGSVASRSNHEDAFIISMVEESIKNYLSKNCICEIHKAQGKKPLQFCAGLSAPDKTGLRLILIKTEEIKIGKHVYSHKNKNF